MEQLKQKLRAMNSLINRSFNKKTVGAALLAILLLLTFFSKTIYTWHLPEVTAVKPDNGQLSKVETANGTAEWAVMDLLYIPEEGTVGTIYVREGEAVSAGQELFTMNYDWEENEQKLQEIENNQAKLETEIQGLENKIAAAANPDAGLLQAQQAAAAAEKAWKAADTLYAGGYISTVEWETARDEYNFQRLNQQNMSRASVELGETLQLELQAKKLELENQILLAAPLTKIREIHREQQVITAPRDGVLVSMPVMAGEKVSKDALAAQIGVGSDYILNCRVSIENDFIVPGDLCTLTNSAHQTKGEVFGILPDGAEKVLSIRFTAAEVAAGETFEVLFEKESEAGFILVPNGAINRDQDGYYLKQIKRREGMMGKEYYLERLDIYVGDSDAKHTAVIQGITFFEPVLLSSNKTALVGDVIRLKNEGDFFEE